MLGTQTHESFGPFFLGRFAKSDLQIWVRNQNMKIFLMGKPLSLIHFPLPTHLSRTDGLNSSSVQTCFLAEHCGLSTHLSDWYWRRGLALQYPTAGTSYRNSYLLRQQTCSTPSCLQALPCGLWEPWFALALLRHVPQGQHVQPRHP